MSRAHLLNPKEYKKRHQDHAYVSSAKPDSILFSAAHLGAMTDIQAESHEWGQLAYIRQGLMEFLVEEIHIIAPAGFAVWLPAGTLHQSYNHKALDFGTINVATPLCSHLPTQSCVISLSPILLAIIDDFRHRQIREPQTEVDQRLAQVMLDQLQQAPRQDRYLPLSEDRLLAPILRALESQPSDNRSLAEWAQWIHSSERTLTRRCSEELGMSFSEWRQRLRFVNALAMLEQQFSVKEIALELGYSSTSAFITMFQSLAGTTPDRYRKSASHPTTAPRRSGLEPS